ncbi:MAG: hypothetical protein JWP97_1838 [Labilithrix sp.]|nr:hypothetical protein [Labilithrix sp.]
MVLDLACVLLGFFAIGGASRYVHGRSWQVAWSAWSFVLTALPGLVWSASNLAWGRFDEPRPPSDAPALIFFFSAPLSLFAVFITYEMCSWRAAGPRLNVVRLAALVVWALSFRACADVADV